MTIQQLQYVLEIARTGSVSQTARNLFLSQPNISNAVKNLEAELGVAVFQRTATGMALTPEGRRLVRRAGGIIQELNALLEDVKGQPDCCFRLNSSRYIPAFEAFADLCQRYQHQPQLHFSCFSDQASDPVRAAAEGQYDVFVFVLPAAYDLTERCGAARLRCEVLLEAPMFVQLAKDHPLAKPGAFSFEALHNYPYVDFTVAEGEGTYSMPFLKFLDPDRLIRAQSITSRRDIVAHPLAFSAVLPHSQEYNDRYGLVNIPIPGTQLNIGYLCPAERPLSPIAQEYTDFFRRRLAQAAE